MEIGFEGIWKIEDPDGSKCLICRDYIYTPNMHVWCLIILNEDHPLFRVCDHCFTITDWDEEED